MFHRGLYYERTGAGEPILFVHGAALDTRMWRPQLAALADRHELIAYDVRGYGRSAMPDGPFRHYEDAAAILDHLDLARVVVVGHSIGALYALELALARPDRIAGCGMICMSGLLPFPGDLAAMLAALRSAPDVDAAKAIWRASGWFTSARTQPALAVELDAMLADYTGWYWTHASPSQNLDPPAVTRLEQLAMPALVVEGELDLPYNHAVAAELARRIPDAEHVRVPAGHMANLEVPEPITRAIAELRRRAARASS